MMAVARLRQSFAKWIICSNGSKINVQSIRLQTLNAKYSKRSKILFYIYQYSDSDLVIFLSKLDKKIFDDKDR